MNLEKRHLLSTAAEAASQLTGLDISIEKLDIEDAGGIDAVVTIRSQDGRIRLPLVISYKLTKNTLGPVTANIRNLTHHRGMVVVPHVPPKLAEELKNLGIPFMDAAGNMFINEPPYFIYVIGQARTSKKHTIRSSVFNPMSMQVIFTLLCMPERVAAAYRDIANDSGVSLGTVANTVRSLEQAGYVVDRGGRGRSLTKVDNLLRRWVLEYGERLRPKLLLGRFSPVDSSWHSMRDGMPGPSCYLSGESAAGILTNYLKPAMQTFFLKGDVKDFAIYNRLKKDPQGTVECLKSFWHFDYPWRHDDLAPPLLIYADLLASGDPRNIETADIIHEQFLSSHSE